MSWKKNGISYLAWLVYVLAVGMGLVCLAGAACDFLEVQTWLGMAVCVVWLFVAGVAVYLIHRCLPARAGQQRQMVRAVAEASVTVIILALGLVLRVEGMGGAGEKAAYFEAASVAPGQGIPQVAQGAVYLYLRLLHSVFYFLGNKFIMGIWLQLLLQFGAALLLYFAVRHCAGKFAATVLLGFCMFSPYMIQEALTLSPEMLYLLLWSAVLLWIATQSGRRFRAFEFLPMGAVVAFLCYLDAAGFFLLLFAVGGLFCKREVKPGTAGKAVSLLLLLAGGLTCFGVCIYTDAFLSGKSFSGVLGAWLALYRPEGFAVPIALEAAGLPVDYIILVCIMTLGIFSFWQDRGSDRIRVWTLAAAAAVLAGCFGVFTAQMPVGVYLYLFLVILAGIGVEECFCRPEWSESLPGEPGLGEGAARQATPMERRRRQLREAEAGEETERTTAPAEAAGEITAEEPEFLDLGPVPPRKPVQYIENPLPLPKKHKKRSLDYNIREVEDGQNDFDLTIDENDDFDI